MEASLEEPNVVCVALLAAASPAGDVLRRQLRERGWQVEIHRDPVAAMTELCLQHRLAGVRAIASDNGHRSLTLVVTDPASWPQWPQLRDAVRRFLPDVTLHTCAAEDVHRMPAPAREPAKPEPVSAENPDEDPDENPDEDPGLLSAAEIEMLLEPLDAPPPADAPPTPEARQDGAS